MPHLDLWDDEAASLIKELADITGNDRYPFSPRIQTLRAVFAKLRPEPPREPSPPKFMRPREQRLQKDRQPASLLARAQAMRVGRRLHQDCGELGLSYWKLGAQDFESEVGARHGGSAGGALQFGLALDEIGTSERRNTEVRLTHR
jgi:hypothetical protein